MKFEVGQQVRIIDTNNNLKIIYQSLNRVPGEFWYLCMNDCDCEFWISEECLKPWTEPPKLVMWAPALLSSATGNKHISRYLYISKEDVEADCLVETCIQWPAYEANWPMLPDRL